MFTIYILYNVWLYTYKPTQLFPKPPRIRPNVPSPQCWQFSSTKPQYCAIPCEFPALSSMTCYTGPVVTSMYVLPSNHSMAVPPPPRPPPTPNFDNFDQVVTSRIKLQFIAFHFTFCSSSVSSMNCHTTNTYCAIFIFNSIIQNIFIIQNKFDVIFLLFSIHVLIILHNTNILI